MNKLGPSPILKSSNLQVREPSNRPLAGNKLAHLNAKKVQRAAQRAMNRQIVFGAQHHNNHQSFQGGSFGGAF